MREIPISPVTLVIRGKYYILLTSFPYWFGLGCFENEKKCGMQIAEMQLIPNK